MPTPSPVADIELEAKLLRSLLAVPLHDAAGVSLSFLLHCAYTRPQVLRRLLNEPVVREGFRGESMLTLLTRVARS